MRILFSLIAFIFNSYFVVAQNIFIDSLKRCLHDPNISGSARMDMQRVLVEQLRAEMMYDSASAENKKYLAFAKKSKAYTDITKAYVNEGVILINQGHYEAAEVYKDSVNSSALASDEKLATAYATYFSLYLTKAIGDYQKAMAFGLESLTLLEKTKGDALLAFKINYQLYGIYTEWNDLENSRKYAQKAIDEALKSGNKNDLSNAYSAMAVVQTYVYEKSKSAADLQAVLDYCEEAASLYQRYPGHVSGYTYSIARNNKASYLLRYSPKITQKIRAQISYNINESLAISSTLSQAQATQTASFGILSNLAKQDGDWAKAEEYMLRAYAILLTQNPIYYHIMSQVVLELSDIYARKGDLRKALTFQKKYDEYRGLLFNQSEAEAVKKLEVQYEAEKKEREIQLLRERAENQRQQTLLYVGAGVIALIGSFYMFRSYHFRLRYSLEREKQLETEKQEAELQIKFEQEEQARLKIEQELLALQQQKLQDEVMANHLHIQHKNDVLQHLKEKLSEAKTVDLKEIIRGENLVDIDFEKAKFQIQEVHPNFFKSLSTTCKQKLTLLDLKYCAYFYIGMETKQIAKILNVEPKSVRMTKYRLKQKLGLDAAVDLVAYLKQMELS